MKYLVYILCIVLFSSCLTKRQWERRYPPIVRSDTLTIVKDSIREVIRDTTIFYPVPGKTVYDSVLVPVPCPDLPEFDLSEFALSKEVQFARAEAWLTYSTSGLKQHLMLEQKKQEIEMHFEGVIRERDYWQEMYTKIDTTEVKEVVVNTFWTRLYRWYFWVTAALGGGFIFARMRRII